MVGQKRIVVFSSLVLFAQIIQGLLLHPYQTMQSLIREKVFAWLSLAPTGLFIFSWLIYRLWLSLATMFKFTFLAAHQWLSVILAFCFDWWLIFLIYWQLLLIYLLLRFAWAFWRN